MKSLFHNTIPSINHSSQIKTSSINKHYFQSQFSPANDPKFILSRQQKRKLSIKAVLDSAGIDQYFGLNASDTRNPTLSSSFQRSRYRKPNQTVLEAQTRVCTGPTQTKPLTEEQAFKVFDTILRSGMIFLVYSFEF